MCIKIKGTRLNDTWHRKLDMMILYEKFSVYIILILDKCAKNLK